ncbi:hypothetical protein BD626DRAFT_495493 [Schizophyllum amplum]|uniref:Uncharacterized protein n=1 Tax=Schizophyllum amplum TaxID=97359 RepID=A0A550CE74_9AGAR|nr:hypothetical protein BD626DRAFT_495493 [Auriculariopsis ampla]
MTTIVVEDKPIVSFPCPPFSTSPDSASMREVSKTYKKAYRPRPSTTPSGGAQRRQPTSNDAVDPDARDVSLMPERGRLCVYNHIQNILLVTYHRHVLYNHSGHIVITTGLSSTLGSTFCTPTPPATTRILAYLLSCRVHPASESLPISAQRVSPT